MLKYIYRIIILVVIFIASLYYFSRDIKVVVFDDHVKTTVMENATFPLVSIKTGIDKINLLHGYSSNLDANMLREAVTPISTDQTFEVSINQESYDIKKLNYEVRDLDDNRLLETNSISVFHKENEDITAKIKLDTELVQGREYAVKLTLISSESKKIFYYHTIKVYDDSHLSDKLNFILEFQKALRNKNTAENMVKYLEPKSDADNSSFAKVNIHSSFDLVSWGELNPEFITDMIPTVKEIDKETACVELNYFVKAQIAGALETFRVKEYYRVRYTPDRMYLLNFDRNMEAIFDVNLASTIKNELKLGITSNYHVPFLASADQKKLVFVRNRELWFYDLDENQMTRVFSFCQEKTDYVRDQYEQHDIQILNMDAEGNVDFLVYGYMNRGQYEGRVAIILYRYYRSDNRIEEKVYIPIDESFQTLKENMGDFAYVNAKEVFYLYINQYIYSYNLITGELNEIAGDIPRERLVFLKDINYIAWQESADPKLSKSICIMNLETGGQQTIRAEEGYNIILMDMIDSNIIYGFAKEGDITTLIDGRKIVPLSEVIISSVDKQILKSYKRNGYYVSAVKVNENVVELTRVQKTEEEGRMTYVPASDDFIMNKIKDDNPVIYVTIRVPDQALSEAYLSLPQGFVLTKIPKVNKTLNTVISKDPTVRLPQTFAMTNVYYPYMLNGVQGAYQEAFDAIAIAKNGIGSVLNGKNQIVWERGNKSSKYTITQFEAMNSGTGTETNKIEQCIQWVLAYQGVNISTDKLSVKETSAYAVLEKYSKYEPVRLTGTALEDVLYYVSNGRPVIGILNNKEAVVIYGYDTFNILIMDPAKKEKTIMGLQDSTNLFKNAGNVFLSYLG